MKCYIFLGDLVWSVPDRITFIAVFFTVASVQKTAGYQIERIVFRGQTTLGGMPAKSCHLASSQSSCINGIYLKRIIRMQQAVLGYPAVHRRLNHCQRMGRKVPVHMRLYQRKSHRTVPQTGCLAKCSDFCIK